MEESTTTSVPHASLPEKLAEVNQQTLKDKIIACTLDDDQAYFQLERLGRKFRTLTDSYTELGRLTRQDLQINLGKAHTIMEANRNIPTSANAIIVEEEGLSDGGHAVAHVLKDFLVHVERAYRAAERNDAFDHAMKEESSDFSDNGKNEQTNFTWEGHMNKAFMESLGLRNGSSQDGMVERQQGFRDNSFASTENDAVEGYLLRSKKRKNQEELSPYSLGQNQTVTKTLHRNKKKSRLASQPPSAQVGTMSFSPKEVNIGRLSAPVDLIVPSTWTDENIRKPSPNIALSQAPTAAGRGLAHAPPRSLEYVWTHEPKKTKHRAASVKRRIPGSVRIASSANNTSPGHRPSLTLVFTFDAGILSRALPSTSKSAPQTGPKKTMNPNVSDDDSDWETVSTSPSTSPTTRMGPSNLNHDNTHNPLLPTIPTNILPPFPIAISARHAIQFTKGLVLTLENILEVRPDLLSPAPASTPPISTYTALPSVSENQTATENEHRNRKQMTLEDNKKTKSLREIVSDLRADQPTIPPDIYDDRNTVLAGNKYVFECVGAVYAWVAGEVASTEAEAKEREEGGEQGIDEAVFAIVRDVCEEGVRGLSEEFGGDFWGLVVGA